MASFSAALVALLVVSCATAAAAKTFVVGDELGWDDLGVYYPDWTIGKTFAVRDTLVFNYTSKAHTVTEVNESGFNVCSGGRRLSNDDSGATTITLTTAGVHYFICNVRGHCGSGDIGMKFAVSTTVAGGDVGSRRGSTIPADNGGAPLVPSSSAVAAAAAGALPL